LRDALEVVKSSKPQKLADQKDAKNEKWRKDTSKSNDARKEVAKEQYVTITGAVDLLVLQSEILTDLGEIDQAADVAEEALLYTTKIFKNPLYVMGPNQRSNKITLIKALMQVGRVRAQRGDITRAKWAYQTSLDQQDTLMNDEHFARLFTEYTGVEEYILLHENEPEEESDSDASDEGGPDSEANAANTSNGTNISDIESNKTNQSACTAKPKNPFNSINRPLPPQDLPPSPPCEAANNGGWSCEHAPSPPTPYQCSIHSANDLDARTFFALFGKPGIPVLLKGACVDWPLRERWSVEKLRSNHGDDHVTLTQSGGAEREHDMLSSSTLSEYVEEVTSAPGSTGGCKVSDSEGTGQETRDSAALGSRAQRNCIDDHQVPNPWFLSTNASELPWLAGDVEHPAHFDRFESDLTHRKQGARLSLGPKHAGWGWKAQGDGWQCLVYGRRQVGLIPSSAHYLSPTSSPSAWWRHVRPTLLREGFPHLHECVQEAGDILYIPASYESSGLNLMDSVSLDVQVGFPLTRESHFNQDPNAERPTQVIKNIKLF